MTGSEIKADFSAEADDAEQSDRNLCLSLGFQWNKKFIGKKRCNAPIIYDTKKDKKVSQNYSFRLVSFLNIARMIRSTALF